jgi:hypothetical protein
MIPRNLAETTPEDIQDLINFEVAESLTLEYKRELPSGQSDQKREFLYDIAAMANAVGGEIVYGIIDRRGGDNQSTGIADSVSGMKLPNALAETNRLENLIRDGIAPRLAGISMQPISCPDGDVLVIRVPRSWNKPHMVTFGGVNRFCARVSAGKYSMSVEEIGRAFSEQRELGEALRSWRFHRVELIVQDMGPVPKAPEVTFLFHAIPASALTRGLLREGWFVPEEEKHRIYVPNRSGRQGVGIRNSRSWSFGTSGSDPDDGTRHSSGAAAVGRWQRSCWAGDRRPVGRCHPWWADYIHRAQSTRAAYACAAFRTLRTAFTPKLTDPRGEYGKHNIGPSV